VPLATCQRKKKWLGTWGQDMCRADVWPHCTAERYDTNRQVECKHRRRFLVIYAPSFGAEFANKAKLLAGNLLVPCNGDSLLAL
jgi:hypothetical protein